MIETSSACRRRRASRRLALATMAALTVGAAGCAGALMLDSGKAKASIPRSRPASADLPRLSRIPLAPFGVSEGAPATGAAAPFVLKAKTPAERQRAARCLADAVYYEAALEPEDGQRAVAQVVLNRLRDPDFPKSVCGVVFQGWDQPPGCQFSFACDGSLRRPPIPALWRKAEAVAEQALDGYVMAAVGTATHYHTTYVDPWWRPTVVRIAQVGAHIFYRWPGAAGLPAAFIGRYAGGEFRISDAVLSGRALPAKPAEASVAAAPEGVKVEKVVVADASAPGGRLTRVHATYMMPGGRRAPTPEEVAQINQALERKFPSPATAAPSTPAVSASSPVATQAAPAVQTAGG